MGDLHIADWNQLALARDQSLRAMHTWERFRSSCNKQQAGESTNRELHLDDSCADEMMRERKTKKQQQRRERKDCSANGSVSKKKETV